MRNSCLNRSHCIRDKRLSNPKNGASLPAGGEPRKPCPAGDHQDHSTAGGKSGKPCLELPAAQLPPSRKAGSGVCQTRDQGHDLLSHHGGVQRSEKVSSVQGGGWIRIQHFFVFALLDPDPATQIGADPPGSGSATWFCVVDFFLFSGMVLIR